MRVISNQNGFTYILALTIVMIMGVMLGMVGQSWKTIKQRESEKELLFRGSQIKEAIENWYNPKYIPGGGAGSKTIQPLNNLNQLLDSGQQATRKPYLPHTYAYQLEENPKCEPDCPQLKIEQDPMTGKKWMVLSGPYTNGANVVTGIIGVASQSNEKTFRNNFRDTSLEVFQNISSTYSSWQFKADKNNDQTKIYRAYHEGW